MSAFLELLLEIVAWKWLDDGVERGQRSRLGRVILIVLSLAAIAVAGWLLTR